MKTEIKYAVFDRSESLLSSIIKDTFSLAVLALMVYISKDSTWWTLVTGLMFIAFLAGKAAVIIGESHKRFHTKEELSKWVESLG